MTLPLPAAASEALRAPGETKLRTLAVALLDAARAAGAEVAKVVLTEQTAVRAALTDGAVSEAGESRMQIARLDLHINRKLGTAVVSGMVADPGALVATAVDQARCAAVTESDPLPFADHMAWDAGDLGIYHPVNLGPEQVMDRARAAQDALLAAAVPMRVASIRSSASAGTRVEVIANSLGLVVSRSMTTYSAACDAALIEDGAVVHGLWEASVRDFSRLIAPEELAARVLARAGSKLHAAALPTGTYRALLEAPIAAQFAEQLLTAMHGSQVLGRGSWLAAMRGMAIAAPWLDVDEDPWAVGALNSSFFDSDGYRTAPRRLVAGGILQGFLHDKASALAFGDAPTGHSDGARNVVFSVPATRQLALDAMHARLGDGIVIGEIFGIGVDLASGRFSLGALGQRLQAGVISNAVNRFMIDGTIGELFESFEAMGDDIEQRGNVRIGSLLIPALSVSGS